MADRVARWTAIHAVIVTLIAASWTAIADVHEGYWPTLALLIVAAAVALALIHETSIRCNDPRLLRLGYVYDAALAFMLLVLATRWSANLAAGGVSLEGDQERFYFQAGQLARDGFRLSHLPSLNYTGVLFVYGVIFRIFGQNPYAPLLVNLLLIVVVTVMLVRVAYKIKSERTAGDWMIGLLLIVPDVLLHGVMPSRDILAMGLVAIAVLAVAEYVLDDPRGRKPLVAAMLVIPALLLLAVVRTPALIPAVGSIVLLLLFFRVWKGIVAVAVPAAVILLTAPLLSERLGGYHVSYSYIASHLVADSADLPLDIFNWHPRSIARLLIPHNAVQAIAYAPPRLVLYLLAPLPFVNPRAATGWSRDQMLMTALSSVVYVLLFPMLLASLYGAITARRAGLTLQIPFWLTMFAIAAGTPLIHERYRLMAVPFLIGCIWLGRTATRREVLWSYTLWGSVLIVGGASAAIYKAQPCATPRISRQPESSTIVAGVPVTLSVRASGDGLSYQWYGGDPGFMGAPVLGASRPTLVVSPRVTSTYWVHVINPCGAVDSSSSVITVK